MDFFLTVICPIASLSIILVQGMIIRNQRDMIFTNNMTEITAALLDHMDTRLEEILESKKGE
jgi:hypothetical protein